MIVMVHLLLSKNIFIHIALKMESSLELDFGLFTSCWNRQEGNRPNHILTKTIAEQTISELTQQIDTYKH